MVGVRRQRDAGDLAARERLPRQLGGQLLVADLRDHLVAGVGLDDVGPPGDLVGELGWDLTLGLLQQPGQVALVPVAERLAHGLDLLQATRRVGQSLAVGVVAAHRLGDLGEVAHPLGRDDLADPGGVADVDRREHAVAHAQPVLAEQSTQLLVERGDAVVVEGRRRGAEDRHVVGLAAEGLAVAHELAADVAQRVLGAASLELVDRHDVGEVEHVDLLQLRGRAELGRHHVERGVDERHDRRVALPDARRLDDDQVEAGGLEHGEHVVEVLGQLARAAGGQRAEVDAVAVEGVHPDPVAEQRAPALAPRRVDGEHRDAQLVLLVQAQTSDELVGQRRLARPARAGDAQDRDVALGGRVPQPVERVLAEASGLGAGDGPGHRAVVARDDVVGADPPHLPQVAVAVGDDGVDHPGEAHPLAVLGGEDRHARVAQPGDLVTHDHPATAADDLHVARAALAQRLDEVLEVLDVPALVGADRDALHVLLDRRVHDVGHRAVVPEVDHLAALALQDPPHDVDRRVVSVEEGRRGDQTHGVGGDVQLAHGSSGGCRGKGRAQLSRTSY